MKRRTWSVRILPGGHLRFPIQAAKRFGLLDRLATVLPTVVDARLVIVKSSRLLEWRRLRFRARLNPEALASAQRAAWPDSYPDFLRMERSGTRWEKRPQ